VDDLVELADDIGEDRLRRVLLRANALRTVAELDRAMAVALAQRLWHRHVNRRDIVERLIARYQFSERTSYRIADEGLERFAKSRGRLAKPASIIDPEPLHDGERDDA
jgi:hypothetical protein